ncbi:hypothetical protein KFK09_001065 [Dendrobium nobile]|uniref:Uncharacterized protein n=1 Tax=Dendrobium nobile TaxID=94219 RepID=A0A8T3CFP2_DENNO|nr:hypothetical protein KFK09_001065 [Dendrobium nobile]
MPLQQLTAAILQSRFRPHVRRRPYSRKYRPSATNLRGRPSMQPTPIYTGRHLRLSRSAEGIRTWSLAFGQPSLHSQVSPRGKSMNHLLIIGFEKGRAIKSKGNFIIDFAPNKPRKHRNTIDVEGRVCYTISIIAWFYIARETCPKMAN